MTETLAGNNYALVSFFRVHHACAGNNSVFIQFINSVFIYYLWGQFLGKKSGIYYSFSK